jgi:ABC-type branched-subunit amino acid transport system substrate-binding protein
MHKGNWRLVVSVLAAALPLAAAAQAPIAGVTAKSILIGQSTPLSGANKELGEDIRTGALAYFKKINSAGGVNGRTIELLSVDDGNDTKRSGANAKELLADKGVLALFGYASATLSRPALPFVGQYKAPFFAPFTGADPMRQFNTYVYNVRASYADEFEKIVEYYFTTGSKRFSIVYYDDPVGKENFAAVERALKKRGLTATSVTAFKDRAKPDIEAGVKEIAKGTPEVVILTTLFKASADFVRAGRKGGLNAQFVSNSFPGSSPLAKELGKEGVGVAIAQVVPPPTRRSLPIVREYQAAIEQLTGKKEYSFTSLEAYIGAKVLVEGIRRAGPRLSRESLIKALDTMQKYDAGEYFVTFSPSDHNGSSFVELTIIGKDLQFSF